MKTAVIGSRNLMIEDFSEYIPKETTEIISGGARGIDSCVKVYAEKNGIHITEIRPEYEKYGRAAPIVRNKIIIEKSDYVVAFWNGVSKGTEFVIKECERLGKSCTVVKMY